MKRILLGALSGALSLALGSAPVEAENLHRIESADEGFAIYRSGKPSAPDMADYCELGITEIMVLSGNADRYEESLREHCPNLRVVFNEEQHQSIPVSRSFLEQFDAWVARAKESQTKIAFRCNCGCHRTGRLAAYYQMKHRGLPLAEAQALMMDRGKWMFLFPGLKKQLQAMDDYIQGRPCSTKERFCVREE